MSDDPANQSAASEPRRLKGQPFTKGDPRIHRGGRPKKPMCIPDLLRWAGALDAPEAMVAKMCAAFPAIRREKMTIARAGALAMWAEALKGNVRAYEVIAERTEGKVTQPISAVLSPGRPVEALSDAELQAEIARLGLVNAQDAPSIGPAADLATTGNVVAP